MVPMDAIWLFSVLTLVLKGIIGYSDYLLEMEIFECFQANRIFVCYFKASQLCTLPVCQLVFYYIMDIYPKIFNFSSC